MIPAAIAGKSVLSEPHEAFQHDRGGSWSTKEGSWEIPPREEAATAIPGRYSDGLLVS
jgi:hypothetical protein